MLKKLYRQAFEAVNVTVGVSSLTVIIIGALTIFGSASLLGLNKIGVKTIPEKHIQQSLEIGMASTIAGSVGFLQQLLRLLALQVFQVLLIRMMNLNI